jgi:transposase
MKNITLHNNKSDGRLTLRALFLQHLKNGACIAAIAGFLLIATATLYSWRRIVLEEGKKVFLTPKRSGPKPDPKNATGRRKLNPAQELEIQTYIKTYRPSDDACGSINSAGWDRKSILELINNLYNITMALQTVGKYLKRWNYTCKKPVKRAYEQKEADVNHYKEYTFKELKAKVKQEDGILYFLDETGIKNNCSSMRVFGPKGVRSTIDLSSQRFSKNVVIALSIHGDVRFMTYNQNMNTDIYIKFLERLLISSKKKIFLVADNMAVHHSKILKEWLKGKENLIELNYLPSYSPELNPVEYINCYIKEKIYKMAPSRNIEQLQTRILGVLKKLQKSRQFAKNFFNQKSLQFMRPI